MEIATKLVILIAIHLLILYSANSAFSLTLPESIKIKATKL